MSPQSVHVGMPAFCDANSPQLKIWHEAYIALIACIIIIVLHILVHCSEFLVSYFHIVELETSPSISPYYPMPPKTKKTRGQGEQGRGGPARVSTRSTRLNPYSRPSSTTRSVSPAPQGQPDSRSAEVSITKHLKSTMSNRISIATYAYTFSSSPAKALQSAKRLGSRSGYGRSVAESC